ncbi:SAM-dependent methyltransferase [candidate division WOR-3 bacterium]|nr:SAM-dependent methyltransferase [candidate division WOR-3 bacterium]
MLLVIIFLVVIIGWLIWKYWTLAVGAGYDPTPMHRVYKMLHLGQVSSSDIVYDLGSGDGRIVIAAARRHGARAVGIEIDPFRYLFATFAVLFAGLRRKVTIKYGSMYGQDISQATVVTLFLYQPTNNKLKEKLQKELSPGTRIVTYMWTFDGWYHTKHLLEDEIYLYIIGEHESGDH